MALALIVTIRGTVGPDVKHLLVNGVEKTLSGLTYAIDVPVSTGFVAITTIDSARRETTRTIQLTAVDGAAG